MGPMCESCDTPDLASYRKTIIYFNQLLRQVQYDRNHLI